MSWLITTLIVLASVLPDLQANNNSLYQCGVRKVVVDSPLNGAQVHTGQWPWHAGIYIWDSVYEDYEFNCGATLIDQRHVLTTAFCVINETTYEERYPAELRVVLGGVLGQHTLLDVTDVQVMGVDQVKLHPAFDVSLDDIALLVLSSDVEFSDNVIPICLDRKRDSSIAKLVGQRLWVAGWGLIQRGTHFNVLLMKELSVVSHLRCIKQDPKFYASHLEEGMFCAAGQNGSTVCLDDSGGGLFYNEGHRWVLKGMVAFAKRDAKLLSCDTASYVGFASVQYYVGWIRELIAATDPTSAVVLQGNDLYQCGVRKRVGVQLIHEGWTTEPGEWPWHVGLYHYARNGTSKKYQCGGVLIDQRHVLTSAHCVVRRQNWASMDPDTVAIHLGQHDRIDLNGVLVVNVSEVHVHPEFSRNRNDIAVLVLDEEVDYSDYVIPVCLDERSADGDISRYFGHRGSVVGWGMTQQGNTSQILRTALMPIVDHIQCVQADHQLFGKFADRGMFCAGERNGTSVCKGDSGGGLYINEGDRWVLKGLTSFSGVDTTLSCDTMSYAGFANVNHYLGWIRNITSATNGSRALDDMQRRKSERACNEYKKLARRRSTGICWNAKHQHSVGVIFESSKIKCSGVLVSNKYVAVPCHCIWEVRPTSVRIGTSDIVTESAVCHPNFKAGSLEHDIALLKLASEVELSSTMIPACLASNWTENLYDTLALTGYFSRSDSKQIEFQESVDNKWLPEDECRRKTLAFGRLANGSHFCMVSPGGELEGFEGLSGSALQTFNTRNCMHTVLGLLNSVASDDAVSFYSRISRVLDWMERTIWGDGRTTQNRSKKIQNTDFVFPDQLR